MGIHMKTTIDMADSLYLDARRAAEEDGTTLRALVEEGLRFVLRRRETRQPFTLRDASFGGAGLAPELADADWAAIRQRAYEGRGG